MWESRVMIFIVIYYIIYLVYLFIRKYEKNFFLYIGVL